MYVRPYRALVAGALVLLMTDGLLQLVGPVLTQRVIDVALPTRTRRSRGTRRCCSRARWSLAFGCSYGETMLTTLLGQRVMRDLRQQLFEHVQRLSIGFYDRTPVGRLVTRVTSRRRIAQRAVHGGSGRGTRRPVHAARDRGDDDRHRLAARARGVRGDPARVSHVAPVPDSACAWRIATSARGWRESTRPCRSGSPACASCSCSAASATRPSGSTTLNRGHLDANLRSITIYALYFPAIEFLTSLALAILLVAGAHRVGHRDVERGRRRGVSPAAAAILSAAAGSGRQVQHAAAGDGGVGADLPAARHRARRRTPPRDGVARDRSAGARAGARRRRSRSRTCGSTTARRGEHAGVGAARRELRRAARRDGGARRPHRARGRRRSSTCCCASTSRSAGGSRRTAWTCATCRSTSGGG